MKKTNPKTPKLGGSLKKYAKKISSKDIEESKTTHFTDKYKTSSYPFTNKCYNLLIL